MVWGCVIYKVRILSDSSIEIVDFILQGYCAKYLFLYSLHRKYRVPIEGAMFWRTVLSIVFFGTRVRIWVINCQLAFLNSGAFKGGGHMVGLGNCKFRMMASWSLMSGTLFRNGNVSELGFTAIFLLQPLSYSEGVVRLPLLLHLARSKDWFGWRCEAFKSPSSLSSYRCFGWSFERWSWYLDQYW